MRVVKEAEERRNEILDAAEALFASKGFEGTSTGDILDKVGIARGTLYYHFKSKEEILDGVIDRMIEGMIRKSEYVVTNEEVPVLDRLVAVLMAFRPDSEAVEEVTEQIHKTQNALMHQKIQERLLAGVVPVLNKLLEEGKSSGMFQTEYGPEALEMIMLYATVMFDDQMEHTPEQLQQRMVGFIYNIERLLGTKPGLMQETVMKIFAANPALQENVRVQEQQSCHTES